MPWAKTVEHYITKFDSTGLLDLTGLMQFIYGPGGRLGLNEIFSMNFALNVPGKEFRRTVYTLIDWVSDLGGLFGTLAGLVSFISAFYNPLVYSVEVVRSNFKIRPRHNEYDI